MSKGRTINIKEQKEISFETGKDPLFLSLEIYAQVQSRAQRKLTFFGGFVGYLGYDLVRFYEPRNHARPPVTTRAAPRFARRACPTSTRAHRPRARAASRAASAASPITRESPAASASALPASTSTAFTSRLQDLAQRRQV